jgi:hypothetical protein
VPPVWFPLVRSRVIIGIPEVKFEKLPASPPPAAALLTSAVCRGFDGALLHLRTTWQQQNTKQQYEQTAGTSHGDEYLFDGCVSSGNKQ